MLAENVPAWFEIPTTDLQRAARFYETILGTTLKLEESGMGKMAVFPGNPPHVTGSLVQAEGYTPDPDGMVIYLNLTQDLSTALERVERAGGKVLLGKTELPDDIGFFAQLQDSEGNRVGLFSQQ